ncbi:DNA-directed RNA polymerase subunit beta [Bacillus dakarensis]|uniref:DNA-directed RNA polymerase subunit beta n=1 Tax=Robertmurraya dakarensis TaxID=1926278 RepID=UPI0009813ACB|nr:DNA-directed RNA polymerase subunit beta [Bacillus dakarensis]
MALNKNNQEVTGAREKYKKEKVKKQQKQEKPATKQRRIVRVRLIPIWLRVILVALLLAVSVIVGAVFGYSVIGDGEAKDVFKKSTWTHMLDLIEKE